VGALANGVSIGPFRILAQFMAPIFVAATLKTTRQRRPFSSALEELLSFLG